MWDVGTTNCGQLDDVWLSNDQQSLAFDFWKNGYGPVELTLQRASY